MDNRGTPVSGQDVKPPDPTTLGLAGVGGGCLAGFGGAALGAALGILICLALPEGRPMRTGGEEAIADHIEAFGRHVMQTITFVGGGTLLGGVVGTLLGYRYGVRRARGPQPLPPAYPVLPASMESPPIAYATPPGRPGARAMSALVIAALAALTIMAIRGLRPVAVTTPAPEAVQAPPHPASAESRDVESSRSSLAPTAPAPPPQTHPVSPAAD